MCNQLKYICISVDFARIVSSRVHDIVFFLRSSVINRRQEPHKKYKNLQGKKRKREVQSA